MPKAAIRESVNVSSKGLPLVSLTDYEVFDKLNIIPTKVVCEAYREGHPHDFSCHTAIVPNAQGIEAHRAADHGGGFRVFTKRLNGKRHPLWRELQASGLEIGEMRCEWCSGVVDLTPNSINPHYQIHKGKNRRAGRGGEWCITFRRNIPLGEFDGEVEEDLPGVEDSDNG